MSFFIVSTPIGNLGDLSTRAIDVLSSSNIIICEKKNKALKLISHLKINKVKIISLSRNFGYQNAILAGLDYSKKDHACILDGDLQDPPELIKNFVLKAKEGFDVVSVSYTHLTLPTICSV